MRSLLLLALAYAPVSAATKAELRDATVLEQTAETFGDRWMQRAGLVPWRAHPAGPLRPVGALPGELAATWKDGSAMTSNELVVDRRGRYLWTTYGCMGASRHLGFVRRVGQTVVLTPDHPRAGEARRRVYDVVEGEEGTRLVRRLDAERSVAHELFRARPER